MTLIEVLIASIILLLTMLPMGILLTSASSDAADTRQRQAALQLADSWVEILSNSQPQTASDGSIITTNALPPTAPAGVQAPSSTLGGTTFNVTASYEDHLVNTAGQTLGQSDLCSAGQPPSPTHPGVIGLQVTVTWDENNNGGEHAISVTTEINYPKPGLQTEGFLAINLSNYGQTDVNGNTASSRLQALPVTITQDSGTPVLNPSSFTLYPDPNGCIFAQVPVGTYDVSVGQPTEGTGPGFNVYSGAPPFVTSTGATTETQPNQQVTITAETIVQLNAFDEGINTVLNYGGPSAVDRGVSCPNGGAVTCVALGDAPSGPSVAWGGAGATWSSTSLASGTSINQVDCTTATSPYCVGVGNGPSGAVIVTTPSTFNSVTNDTVPTTPATVTDLTQVVCMSANGCYAVGTSSGGPVLLAGEVGQGNDRWVEVAHPGITFTGINSLACPTSTTCELSYAGAGGAAGVLRLDGDPALLALNPFWTPIVNSDTLPSILPQMVTSVGTITCPTTTTCLATAVGDQSSSTDPTIIAVTVAGSGPSTWSSELNFPTGASSVTGLSCTATTCVAIGTATGAPAVWTGDLTQQPFAWTQSNGIPTNPSTPNHVVAVTSVACGNPAPSDTADCVVAAITSAQSGSGELLTGSQSPGNGWAWNPATLPSDDTVQYFEGVSCESPPSAANATCAAVGATSGAPVILTSATGSSGTWNDVTPTTLPGATVTGIPIEIATSGVSNWSNPIKAGVGANATTLGNALFPQQFGYNIAAGDCPAEATGPALTNLSAPPGGTATSTVPLGLLPLQLIGTTGAPLSGATVTITSLSCLPDSYDLPASDATGLTMASVPYGSYSYTVTVGTSAVAYTSVTITVGANSIQVQSTASGTPVTYYLPSVIPVSA